MIFANMLLIRTNTALKSNFIENRQRKFLKIFLSFHKIQKKTAVFSPIAFSICGSLILKHQYYGNFFHFILIVFFVEKYNRLFATRLVEIFVALVFIQFRWRHLIYRISFHDVVLVLRSDWTWSFYVTSALLSFPIYFSTNLNFVHSDWYVSVSPDVIDIICSGWVGYSLFGGVDPYFASHEFVHAHFWTHVFVNSKWMQIPCFSPKDCLESFNSPKTCNLLPVRQNEFGHDHCVA